MANHIEDGTIIFSAIEGFPGQGDKIALVHDKDKPEPILWKLPGGTVRKGESIDVALYRELSEEINTIVAPLNSEDVPFVKQLKGHRFIAVKATYHSGESRPQEDVEKLIYRTKDQIRGMIQRRQIVPTHAEALTFLLDL